MSLLEIKQQITKLTSAERQELNAYLLRLRNESREGQVTVSTLMGEMDKGKKVSMSELEDRIQDRHGEWF